MPPCNEWTHGHRWRLRSPFDAPVFERLFVEREANHLQFDLSDVALADGCWIELTSIFDGETQRITPNDLVDGGARSAYFNGFAVRIAMWAKPGADAPYARITRIDRGLERYFDPESICGPTDNRTLRSRRPICRLLIQRSGGTYVCSGWLVSDRTGGHVTAGHCLSGATGVTAQYNVPTSTSSGAIRNPPSADQYAWRSNTRRFSNAGVGSDWGVFRVNGNPFTRQRARFTFASANTTSTHVRNGYGTASGSRNFAQKDHTGRDASRQTAIASLRAAIAGSGAVADFAGAGVGRHAARPLQPRAARTPRTTTAAQPYGFSRARSGPVPHATRGPGPAHRGRMR